MANLTIPADIAGHLTQIASAMQDSATRLERLHALWGDGEEDGEYPDGTRDEWHVHVEHSEIERLIANLRSVAEFSAWLATFEQGGCND